jgi:hypothetical protein
MTYDEMHPTIRAVIGTWEGYRKAGFKADDIYCEVAANPECPPGHLMVFTTLKAQGKEFRIGVGIWAEADIENLAVQWKSACAAVAGGQVPQADCDRIWQESLPHKDAIGFILALQDKGFAIPSAARRRMS